jgi:hypothetical protein
MRGRALRVVILSILASTPGGRVPGPPARNAHHCRNCGDRTDLRLAGHYCEKCAHTCETDDEPAGHGSH